MWKKKTGNTKQIVISQINKTVYNRNTISLTISHSKNYKCITWFEWMYKNYRTLTFFPFPLNIFVF